MKKMINEEIIEGRIYQHDLVVKKVQNSQSANFGKDFISGTIEIAVDEEAINVVPVHFTYVTATTGKGTANVTYSILNKIINENKTWMNVGKENAACIRCRPSLDLNEFYDRNDAFVSLKVNEGGFIDKLTPAELNPDINKRTKFTTDILINKVREIEPDDEKGIKGGVVVGGAVFNFRNELLPVEFTVCEAGQSYFLGLGASASNPILTKVWGKITCSTEKIPITENSAFGEASVTIKEKKTRDWMITGTAEEPYAFGDAEVMTAEDITKATQDRELKKATIKKNKEEYQAKKASGAANAATPNAVAASIPAGGFQF